jgi:SAM-dependent methyltransferase
VSFACGDASALPFKDESLDAVFGFGYLHHVIAWRRSISDVSRVLKQGGVYYMEEYYPSFYQNAVTRHLFKHPDRDRFNSHDLRQAFSEANLTLTHTFELKKMGILGVGVKARQQAIRCKRSESACHLEIDDSVV